MLIVSFNTKSFGQEKSENKIVLPIEVKAAFEKRYPDVKASWTREYRGYNNDQLRYEAKFRGSKGNDLAVFDNLGNLKAFESSIALSHLPKKATNYLKKAHLVKKFTEAVKFTDIDIKYD